MKIEGNSLKAGTYALYTIPGEREWTVIVHTNTRHRSIAGDVYKSAEDAFRFKVKPGKASNYVETFTIGFSHFSTSSCRLFVAWENTEIKFSIEFDVDSQVDKQIVALASSTAGMSHQNHFLAAEYYLHNNKDLSKADQWIMEAMEKSPKNSRYGLPRAKILCEGWQERRGPKSGRRSQCMGD